MIYQINERAYDMLRKEIKSRDLQSTEDRVVETKDENGMIVDTNVIRSFSAPHPTLTAHAYIKWYLNNMLGLPADTITELRVV